MTRRLYCPGKRASTHCSGGWVCPRAGLDGCEKSSPIRASEDGDVSCIKCSKLCLFIAIQRCWILSFEIPTCLRAIAQAVSLRCLMWRPQSKLRVATEVFVVDKVALRQVFLSGFCCYTV